MDLCIVGWYYVPTFYDTILDWTLKRRSAVVVTHREPTLPLPCPSITEPNIGLEWGAYDAYLRKAWNGKSPVLFMHDDTIIEDSFFQKVEERCATFDVAFIFPDAEQARINGRAHGRCVYMSREALHRFKGIGFWHDVDNTGDVQSTACNNGIQHFLMDLRWLQDRRHLTPLVVGCVYVEGADFGYRGALGEAGAQYRASHFR